jgi:hypothetical protein
VISLYLRALIAFLLLPGTVALVVPWLLAATVARNRPIAAIGWVPLLSGAALLLSCVREFVVAGRGTLVPWAPPQRLVATGPYRFS